MPEHRRRHAHRAAAGHTWRWWAGWSAAALVVLILALLAVSAVRALDSARNSMQSARTLIERDISDRQDLQSRAGRLKVARDLAIVAHDAASATAALHSSVGLQVFGEVPYLSDQRNGVQSLVRDVGMASDMGTTLLNQVNVLVSQSSGTSVSLPALESLDRSITVTRTRMLALDRPADDLFGSLGAARNDFDREVVKITTLLAKGEQTVNYALPFLGEGGPRTYLVAGENNAEMRDQGAVLSLALLRTNGGNLNVTTMGSVDSLEPASAVDVPIPPGTDSVFGGYRPTSLWQSVNADASFPLSAEIMQAMTQQVSGVHVNGVIALDVPALESLLQLTGPVAVPTIAGPITAGNVADVILHQQYTQYPAAGDQAERHDNISAVAQAVVDQMQREHVDLAAFAEALANDVAGRHLLVWDENAGFEGTVRALGASGEIDTAQADRTFHVAVENSTATKLDYYVRVSIAAHVRITNDGDAAVSTAVTVKNDTPTGLAPNYQIGPDGINSHTPGQYVARVLLWSPRGSVVQGGVSDAGLELSQSQVSVLPQRSQTILFTTVISHAVKNGEVVLRYVPQPRLEPESLDVDLSAPGWTVGGADRQHRALVDTTRFTWTLHR